MPAVGATHGRRAGGWKGTLVALFQPAEEPGDGADRMLTGGATRIWRTPTGSARASCRSFRRKVCGGTRTGNKRPSAALVHFTGAGVHDDPCDRRRRRGGCVAAELLAGLPVQGTGLMVVVDWSGTDRPDALACDLSVRACHSRGDIP